MEVVKSLATQKIRELLAICGIGHRSDEPLQEHINNIANYVHTTRVKDGIEGFTEPILTVNAPIYQTPPSSPRELRGSYRVLSRNVKRGPSDFQGLTSPSKKKKKKRANKEYNPLGPSEVNLNCNDAATAAKTTHQTDSTDQPPTADRMTTTDGVSGKSTTSPNIPSSLDPSMSTAEDTTRTSLTTDSVVLSVQSHLPILLDPVGAIDTMTSILWNCVKLNNIIGKHGRQSQQVWSTTEVEKMRLYADEIAQHEYKEAVRIVRRDNALLAGKDMQGRYNETIYWDIISKGAKLIDPATLPTPKGPLDDFTMAEKVATKVFMEEAGVGVSMENQRRCRNLWKKLSEMRQAGIGKILLYRTKEFDAYCKSYTTASSLTDVVMSWEKVFGPLLEQLENRMMARSAGDFTGVSDLVQAPVAEVLDLPKSSWTNAFNKWRFKQEASAFGLAYEPVVASDPLWCISDQYNVSESGQNKSIFIFLFPGKNRFLSVCPIVPVNQGDILGIFAGRIRFSDEFDNLYGIRGPFEKLWLDYSQITGTLNQMKVSRHSNEANVQLHWEPVNERGDKDSRVSWIVSVRAIKAITPFEEIVREAPQKEQYLLHRSEIFAGRGFTKKKPEP
uniref:Uncharacterized protein n=1 Tax=Talaromyces marneffei PM1 TaxID=1077442 RepID=A0A093UXY3_TALMA